MKLNGSQLIIALVLIGVISALVWAGKLSSDVLVSMISLIAGYYFGEARAFRRANRDTFPRP